MGAVATAAGVAALVLVLAAQVAQVVREVVAAVQVAAVQVAVVQVAVVQTVALPTLVVVAAGAVPVRAAAWTPRTTKPVCRLQHRLWPGHACEHRA